VFFFFFLGILILGFFANGGDGAEEFRDDGSVQWRSKRDSCEGESSRADSTLRCEVAILGSSNTGSLSRCDNLVDRRVAGIVIWVARRCNDGSDSVSARIARESLDSDCMEDGLSMRIPEGGLEEDDARVLSSPVSGSIGKVRWDDTVNREGTILFSLRKKSSM